MTSDEPSYCGKVIFWTVIGSCNSRKTGKSFKLPLGCRDSVSWLFSPAPTQAPFGNHDSPILAGSGELCGVLLFSRHNFCSVSHRAIIFTPSYSSTITSKGWIGWVWQKEDGTSSSESWSELCHYHPQGLSQIIYWAPTMCKHSSGVCPKLNVKSTK